MATLRSYINREDTYQADLNNLRSFTMKTGNREAEDSSSTQQAMNSLHPNALHSQTNSFLENLQATVENETSELIAATRNIDLSELTYEEKQDYYMRLYVGDEILSQYQNISTPNFGTVLPRYKVKTGQRKVKLKIGDRSIQYNDEWSSPFSFESKSMMDLNIFEDRDLEKVQKCDGVDTSSSLQSNRRSDESLQMLGIKYTRAKSSGNMSNRSSMISGGNDNNNGNHGKRESSLDRLPRRKPAPAIPTETTAPIPVTKLTKKLEQEISYQLDSLTLKKNQQSGATNFIQHISPETYQNAQKELNSSLYYTRVDRDVVTYSNATHKRAAPPVPAPRSGKDGTEAGAKRAEPDFDFLNNW